MILWTTVILGSIAYILCPALVQFICSLICKSLCSLWEDFQGVVQSTTVRGVVCQAVVGSITIAGTILILPCIIVQRLWPVTSSHQHLIDPPYPKDMQGSPYIPPSGEQPAVKTSCAGRGKHAACGRTKHMPFGQIYYCASHMDQCPRR